jgi:type I restriction-modification system DNA methylase subunit
MAFVVPSGFLDGANDTIKAKIAEKGRLLEAWRLPNGVFNTTGVGTDIVIIRKEKGGAADFSDGLYFKDNSTHILGDVTERVNQFGKMQKYVSLPQGEIFDSVIDGIPAGEAGFTPLGRHC